MTPTSYLELIYTYKELLGQQRAAVLQLRRRYEVGRLLRTTVAVSCIYLCCTQLQAHNCFRHMLRYDC